MVAKNSFSSFFALCCILFGMLYHGDVEASSLTGSKNLLSPYGGFELGIPDLEVYCYPRYVTKKNTRCEKPVLANDASMEGKFAFQLAGRSEGGYLLVFKPLNLEAGKRYNVEFLAKSISTSTIRVDIRANSKRIKTQRLTIQPGLHKYKVNFIAAENHANNDHVVHTMWLNIKAPKMILLDQIAINETDMEKVNDRVNGLAINVDDGVGIYQRGTNHTFTLYYIVDRLGWLDVSISDPVSEKTIYMLRERVQGSPSVTTLSIPMRSKKPGYFEIQAKISSDSGDVLAHKNRGYVILDQNNRSIAANRRFGLAVEEHGYVTKSNAFLPPDAMYKLINKMGAGSLRIFSLASPNLVSRNGTSFNFSELSAALDLAKHYDLEPLVMLGENSLEMLPDWLTLNKPATKFDFDIAEGISVKRVRKSVLRSIGESYFNSEEYRRYLDALFSSFRGRVHYYSFWNEPAYKFNYYDLSNLLKMTHDRLSLKDKSAKLVGFSSTTHGDVNRGDDLNAEPSFLKEMAEGGNLKYIDILSYHSAHAFRFNSSNYNEWNYETGYEQRIFRTVNKYLKNLPLWDTERGVAWVSRIKGALDHRPGNLHKQESNVFNWLAPAIQLPVIYASEFANGVGRVFWFYFDSTSNFPIMMPKRSRSMFGAEMEPTPQIAVYAAMTKMLGDIPFKEKRTDDKDNRMYIFGNNHSWVAVIHNWKLNDSMIKVKEDCSSLKVFDVMGRQINGKLKRISGSCEIVTGKWPVYVKYNNTQSG